MKDEKNVQSDNDLIDEVSEFVSQSSRRFATTIQRAVSDLRMYSGDFWTKDMKRKYKRGKKTNLFMNNWTPLSNAISSPISNSPWHIELTDREQPIIQDIQKAIDEIESDTDSKLALIDGFRKEILCGYGFLVLSTVQDEFTGEPKIIIESVKNLGSVAIDPTVNTEDASDAEKGAIINFISIDKAKRLYGSDVVPMMYPDTDCRFHLPIDQIMRPAGCCPIVTYYRKNESGLVDMYKICGSKVVDHIELPIKFIPIIRLSGNEVLEGDEINYNGIVQQTMSLQLGINIAYSTLVERVGRSAKANVMVHQDALIDQGKNVAVINQDDTAGFIWKGDHQPVILNEEFRTGDLQNTIQTCRTLIEDSLGIPLSGIVDQKERTATEILRQEASKESNTASYYNHAYKAMRTLGRLIIEMLNGGEDLRFKLENGPSVITRQMKQRQELTAMSTVLPEEMKPILAKFFADTLKNEIGEDLSKQIVANLPPNLQIISDNEDPNAIHVMNQMQSQMNDAMTQLDQLKAENEQLRQQLNQSQLSLLENREQRQLDFQKFLISEQDKLNIEAQKLENERIKLGIDAQKNSDKARNDEANSLIKEQEVNIKAAEAEMKMTEQVTDKAAQEMIVAVPVEE